MTYDEILQMVKDIRPIVDEINEVREKEKRDFLVNPTMEKLAKIFYWQNRLSHTCQNIEKMVENIKNKNFGEDNV